MSFFDDTELFTCVACDCDDNHACSGGCSWVIQNLETMQGLCSACVRDGLAALIELRLVKSPLRENEARCLYQGNKYRTASQTNPRGLAAKTALKIFGPGARLVMLSEHFIAAIPPKTYLILVAEISAGAQTKRRPRRTAAAACGRSAIPRRTVASTADD